MLQRVVITPATITLAPGATQQFAVAGLLSDGSTTAVTVTFTATGGAIAPTGLYTADSVAGSYRVIAAEAGGLAARLPSPWWPGPVLRRVVLTPASVTLAAGASPAVRRHRPAQTTRPPPISATSRRPGAPSPTGLYTAASVAGSYRVIATEASGLADTATVAVVAAAPVLQHVVLTPASVTLAAGATQQFAVTGRLSDGSTTAVTATFTATGGTIAPTGLYTAASVAGSYRVIATEASGLADTAAPAHQAPAPPPPPPPPPSTPGYAGCPAGATPLATTDDWAAKAAAAAQGTIFCAATGTTSGRGTSYPRPASSSSRR